MYLTALSAVNTTNNARLRVKKARQNDFMTFELEPYGKLRKRMEIDPVPVEHQKNREFTSVCRLRVNLGSRARLECLPRLLQPLY